MNKKHFFVLLMVFLVTFGLGSLLLSRIFPIAKKEFEGAFGGCLGAVWQCLEAKYALRPNNPFHVNAVKRMYHWLGIPKVYRIQCWIVFSIFLLVAIPFFISGMCIIL